MADEPSYTEIGYLLSLYKTIEVNLTTHRQFRNELARLPLDTPYIRSHGSHSNFAKLSTGTYGTDDTPALAEVRSDGSVVFAKEAYPDDVVAFVLCSLRSNPNVSDELKQHLADFVNGMDARAVARHGYAGDERERALVWKEV